MDILGTSSSKIKAILLALPFVFALPFCHTLKASELPWCSAKIVFKKFPPPPANLQNVDTSQDPVLQNVMDMLLARAYYRPSEQVIYISEYLQQPRLREMRIFVTAHECAHHEQFRGEPRSKLAVCHNKAGCSLGFSSLFTRRFLLEADASCRAVIKLAQHNKSNVLDYMKQHYSQVQRWHIQKRFIGKYMIMGTRNDSILKTLEYCRRPGASIETHLKLWTKQNTAR